MNRWSKTTFLADEIGLLVRHFGIERVRRALAKVSIEDDIRLRLANRKQAPSGQEPTHKNGAKALELIREIDPEKYHLLNEFLSHLKRRAVLPESQDIRYFAQMVGLKEITGKSREDMVSKLIHFLVDQPIEKLRIGIKNAANISEQQRMMGFSILTDKLLGKS